MTHRSRTSLVCRILLGAAAVAAMTCFAESPASAQYGRAYRGGYGGYYGSRDHGGGFLRFTAGFGYMDATDNDRGSSISFYGAGVTFSGAVGGTVAPNLAVYGEFLATSAVDTSQSDGYHYTTYSGLDLLQYGIGPGLSYYFEPVNLYIAGSILLTRVSFSDSNYGDPIASSRFGVGGSFMVGKEWWVSPDWGIGIAGHVQYASMTNTLYDRLTDLSTFVFSVLFTATYN
jgi:hypothetical protein